MKSLWALTFMLFAAQPAAAQEIPAPVAVPEVPAPSAVAEELPPPPIAVQTIPAPAVAPQLPVPTVREPRVGVGIDPLQLLGNQLVSLPVSPSPSSIATSTPESRLASLQRYRGATIFVPVNVMPMLRVEASLGFYSYAGGTVAPDPRDENQQESGSITNGGLGAFYRFPGLGNIGIYVGPRIGISYLSQTIAHDTVTGSAGGNIQTGKVSLSSTQWSLTAGAAAGGEWFFAPGLSFGADVEGGIRSVRPISTTLSFDPPRQPYPSDTSTTVLPTNGGYTGAGLRLRYYFL